MKFIMAAITLLVISGGAAASPVTQFCGDRVCVGQHQNNAPRAAARGRYRVSQAGTTMLAHPAGCPRVAFCACGAAVKVFGKAVRALWPARAWFRFPRAHAGSEMVAVRRHHVFVLDRQAEGGLWWVWDYNSGHHQSRHHIRDISGFTIVNPLGRLARL